LPGFVFVNIGYYNINYGGFWIGWSSTKKEEEGDELRATSVGFSIKIK